jgi:hypothetical protein
MKLNRCGIKSVRRHYFGSGDVIRIRWCDLRARRERHRRRASETEEVMGGEEEWRGKKKGEESEERGTRRKR